MMLVAGRDVLAGPQAGPARTGGHPPGLDRSAIWPAAGAVRVTGFVDVVNVSAPASPPEILTRTGWAVSVTYAVPVCPFWVSGTTFCPFRVVCEPRVMALLSLVIELSSCLISHSWLRSPIPSPLAEDLSHLPCSLLSA